MSNTKESWPYFVGDPGREQSGKGTYYFRTEKDAVEFRDGLRSSVWQNAVAYKPNPRANEKGQPAALAIP